MKYSFIFLAVIVVCLTFSNQINSAAAQFSYFVSSQLAPSPSNGKCLTTNGSTNAWGDCGTGGGGTPGGSTTQVQFNNAGSFAGDSGMIYSSSTDTLSVVSINATNSTTTRLAVTGTGTSTFAGGINTGANHIVTHGVQSDASDGLHIHAGNGTDVGLFGAGNTANSLFYGAVNIDGNTRIATTTNGVLVANAGAITASGTPTVATLVATSTTGTSTFANAVGIGTTTPIGRLEVANNTNGGNVSYLSNPNTGTGAYTELNIRNANTSDIYSDGLRLLTLGTGWTTTGAFVQDGSALMTDSNLAGGMSLATLGVSANMRFYTAGFADANERMRITSGGLVGIGTTSPVTTLAVNGSTTITSNLQVNGGTLFVDATNNRIGIGTTTPEKRMSIVSEAVRTPWVSFYDHLGNRAIDIISATSTTASSTAFGLESLQSVTTGEGLTAVGNGALRAVTTGSSNTAMGSWALRANTTGSNNTAIGLESGQAITSGSLNTAVGSGSLRQNTTGTRNLAIGYQALYANSIGASNIAIGNTSARYLADGATTNVGATSSIYIGHNILSASAGSLNEIVIGNHLTGNGTNTATFGNSSLSTLFAGKVGIGTTTPSAQFSVQGTSTSRILQLLSNTGTKFMEMLNTGVTTLLGTWDFSGATVKQHTYSSFTWPVTATTTSATTTLPLGTAYTAESWSGVDCWVSSSTGAFIFTDGTNRMNGATATTTVARTTLSTNNTFTAQERRYVEIGPLTEAQLSCTVDKIVNN